MWLKKAIIPLSLCAHIQVTGCPLRGDGWDTAVGLATAAVIKYFPSKSESIKNILTNCTLHFSHVINLLLYLKTILLPLAGHNCGIFLSSEDTIPAWFLEGLWRHDAEAQKRSFVQVAAGRGTGEVQGTSRGLAEDTARSKSLYSSQTQVANAGQRSAKALPIWEKDCHLVTSKISCIPHSAWAPTPKHFWARPKANGSIYSCCKTPTEYVQVVVTCS